MGVESAYARFCRRGEQRGSRLAPEASSLEPIDLCRSDIIGVQRAKELEEAWWTSRQGEAGTEAVLAQLETPTSRLKATSFQLQPTIEKLSSSGNPSPR